MSMAPTLRIHGLGVWPMKRYGWMIGLRATRIDRYKELHAAVWDDVLETISSCNIRNYTIFLREPENVLFGYFEYHGADFDSDMAKMSKHPRTQEWWQLTDPCQSPLETATPTEKWATMEEVFHHD